MLSAVTSLPTAVLPTAACSVPASPLCIAIDSDVALGPARHFVAKLNAVAKASGGSPNDHLRWMLVSHTTVPAKEGAQFDAWRNAKLPSHSGISCRDAALSMDCMRKLVPKAPVVYLTGLQQPTMAGSAVGHILASTPAKPSATPPEYTPCVRLGFDFDGVLASDASEVYYQKHGLQKYRQHEDDLRFTPLPAGPLWGLFKGMQRWRDATNAAQLGAAGAKIELYVITARGEEAMRRVSTSMHAWGLRSDVTLYCNGGSKTDFIKNLNLDFYCDDQHKHLTPLLQTDATLAVFVPNTRAQGDNIQLPNPTPGSEPKLQHLTQAA